MEKFLIGLLYVSVATGLVTEGIKIICTEHGWTYYSNTIAGIVSVLISVVGGVIYILWTGIEFSIRPVIVIIALAVISWLCSMVGYDKVIQTISQFKKESE